MSEIIITCFFFVFLLLLGVLVWRVWLAKYMGIKLFLAFVIVKLSMSLLFGVVYSTYYANSDTTNYYEAGSVLWELLEDKEYQQAKGFIKASELKSSYIPYIGYNLQSGMLSNRVPFFMSKLSSFIQLITFNSFFASGLIFAFLCLLALARLYIVLIKDFEKSKVALVLALFFYPTVLFWTSGILKDTVILFSVSLLVSSVYEIMMQKKRYLINSIIILLVAYLIFQLRLVVLIVLIICTTIWVFAFLLMQVKRIKTKVLVYPLSIVAVFSILSGLFYIGDMILSEFGISKLFANALKFQLWHSYLFETGKVGSGYSLTELTLTPFGIIRAFFESVNVSLFRPYIWEANNPFMYVVSLESLSLFFITVFVILRVGVINCLRRITSNPFLFFSVIYALFFLAIVGFISYNFGALVRYKVVGIAFYLISLALLYTWDDSYVYAK